MMKKYGFWVALFCFLQLLPAAAQTFIEAGEVSGSWTRHGSPYIINGTITIPSGSELVIEPGVMISFAGHYKFEILGKLIATGNVTDSIIFTAADPKQGWHGLRFLNTITAEQDTSRLQYCRIEFGRVFGDCPDNRGGAVYAELARLNIRNCLIRYNRAVSGAADWGGGAIYLEKTNAVVADNLITMNYSGHDGGGIYCSFCNPKIIRNTVTGNQAAYRGGGIAVFTFSSPAIQNNIITNNTAADHGGGINISGGNPLVQHNYIEENQAGTGGGGISCYLSNARIINNQIVSNKAGSGGALDFRGSSPSVFANTVCNNQATGNGSGISNSFEMAGLPVYSNPVLTSNIIFYNTGGQGSQIWSASGCEPFVSYCAIENMNGEGISGGMNDSGANTEQSPLFISLGENPWMLSSNSPCVDAGPSELSGTFWPDCDLGGCVRVWDGNGDQLAVIDIGAWEFGSQPLGTEEANPVKKGVFSCIPCPNPAGESVSLLINTPQPGEINIIITLTDGRVLLRTSAYVSEEDHRQIISLSRLPTGVYIYEVYYMGHRLSGRLVHL
ncbi:MAG: T9SS type A sorting domain-containing protein [Lentimicrobium sp.]